MFILLATITLEPSQDSCSINVCPVHGACRRETMLRRSGKEGSSGKTKGRFLYPHLSQSHPKSPSLTLLNPSSSPGRLWKPTIWLGVYLHIVWALASQARCPGGCVSGQAEWPLQPEKGAMSSTSPHPQIQAQGQYRLL